MNIPGQGRAKSERPLMGLLSEDFLKVSEGIVGTCQDIEMSYVRITSHPDPSTVRPEPVLRLALAKVGDQQPCLTKSVYEVVLQKSIPAQIRQIVLYFSNNKG